MLLQVSHALSIPHKDDNAFFEHTLHKQQLPKVCNQQQRSVVCAVDILVAVLSSTTYGVLNGNDSRCTWTALAPDKLVEALLMEHIVHLFTRKYEIQH
ncbi:MAG: hypothetical protein ACXWPS_14695 [Ktedonobacteraceae bacterium]